MKTGIFALFALGTSLVASLAGAATYTYTFDDMSFVPDKANFSFNTSRYWENRGTDRWGTVWESPYTFTTTYPSQTSYAHHHIGFKGQEECVAATGMGKFVNGVCTALSLTTNRGPFSTHTPDQALYFQLVKQNGTMVPFVVKNIDVYNASDESITLFVRKTDGGWFYWDNLHGYGDGTPSYFRWTLTSGYTGKFQAMAWKTIAGAVYPSSVGRVQITD